MTMTKLQEWLRLSRKGDSIEYFRGVLPVARERDEHVDKLAAAALLASQLKFVRLVQKKHAAYDYSYMMVRR